MEREMKKYEKWMSSHVAVYKKTQKARGCVHELAKHSKCQPTKVKMWIE